jgi:hypothetical protein
MIGIIYDSDEKNDSGYTIYMWYLTLSCVYWNISRHTSIQYYIKIIHVMVISNIQTKQKHGVCT